MATLAETTYQRRLKREKQTQNKYLVKRGDTWPSIAQRVYGSQARSRELARANKQVSRLRPGMALKLPKVQAKGYDKAPAPQLPASIEQAAPPRPTRPTPPAYIAQAFNPFNIAQAQAAQDRTTYPGLAGMQIPAITPGAQPPNAPPATQQQIPYTDIRGQAANVMAGDYYVPPVQPAQPPGYQMRAQETLTPSPLEPPGKSLAAPYLSQGIFPPIINAGDPVLGQITPAELVAAGYVYNETYGNWIRMDYGPGQSETYSGAGAGTGYRGGGGYSGRGGYTPQPYPGRRVGLTGRDLYTVSLGLINWRI